MLINDVIGNAHRFLNNIVERAKNSVVNVSKTLKNRANEVIRHATSFIGGVGNALHNIVHNANTNAHNTTHTTAQVSKHGSSSAVQQAAHVVSNVAQVIQHTTGMAYNKTTQALSNVDEAVVNVVKQLINNTYTKIAENILNLERTLGEKIYAATQALNNAYATLQHYVQKYTSSVGELTAITTTVVGLGFNPLVNTLVKLLTFEAGDIVKLQLDVQREMIKQLQSGLVV